jgi:hypothetical protein
MLIKKPTYTSTKLCITAFLSLTISACGGGGNSSTPETPSTPPQNDDTTSIVVESFLPTNSAHDSSIITRDCLNAITDTTAVFTDISDNVGLCYETSISAEDGTPARVAGGIAVDDYDGDGHLDLYVTHGRNSPGRLFKQQADGNYIDMTQQAGISSISTDLGGAFIDINHDGLPDLISVQEGPSFLQVYNNNGDGTFSDITDTTGLNLTKPSFSISAGDYDLDGDLDLHFTHWNPTETQDHSGFLWQQQQDNTFIDISDVIEISSLANPTVQKDYSFTSIFADVNQDRFPDLLIASDFSYSQITINNNGITFIDTTTSIVNDRAGMGATVADYDNDGDLDWFVSAIGDTREEFLRIGLFNGSRLYQNDGDGNFTNVTDIAGVRQGFWAWGTCFADFNNDGHDDLFVVNGYDGWSEAQSVSGNYDNFNNDPALLYISNGDGTFTNKATELGVLHTAMGRGLVCYDYDRDGDLDMLIANSGEAPTLYRNNTFSADNNFINIRLKGLSTTNPHAVGARIYIAINGQEQMKELQLGSGYISQNPVEAHFGLGNADTINQIRIVWPGLAGIVSEINNVDVNRFLIIHQPEN